MAWRSSKLGGLDYRHLYLMKIKEQTRELTTDNSKHCFEVVDNTDQVSLKHWFEVADRTDKEFPK